MPSAIRSRVAIRSSISTAIVAGRCGAGQAKLASFADVAGPPPPPPQGGSLWTTPQREWHALSIQGYPAGSLPGLRERSATADAHAGRQRLAAEAAFRGFSGAAWARSGGLS